MNRQNHSQKNSNVVYGATRTIKKETQEEKELPRYDRINNLTSNGITKRKRIRNKHGPSIMNTLSKNPFLNTTNDEKLELQSKADPYEQEINLNIKSISSNSDSESDFDLNNKLIEVSQYSSSPIKNDDRTTRYEELDEMIKDAVSGNVESPIEMENSVVNTLLSGDFLSSFDNRKKQNRIEMEIKFKDVYPKPILSKRKLHMRVQKYLPVVLEILKGNEDPCYTHSLGASIQRGSNHETMSQKEKWEINWSALFGGYFGLQRQQLIGNLILQKFDKQIKIAAKKNPIITYWSEQGYATFMLANDIIVRLIMEDFNCSYKEAEKIMKESADYGSAVADDIDIIDDIELASDEDFEIGNGNVNKEICLSPSTSVSNNKLIRLSNDKNLRNQKSDLDHNHNKNPCHLQPRETSSQLSTDVDHTRAAPINDILSQIIQSDSESDDTTFS